MTRRRPYPYGWYSPAFSSEVRRGEVVTRKLAGREVVLFRTESGQINAMDPVCPHLGAHLGHGGTVEGESIQCPFHAFRFDGTGTCVATGYGTKPPKTRARMYASCERQGAILVWLDPAGRAPLFEIPELETDGWTELKTHTFHLQGHPQETTENSVDLGHFRSVHGYDTVKQMTDLKLAGPYLNTSYAMTRPIALLGRRAGSVSAEFEVHVHGLGYSLVEVLVKAGGFRMRNFVYATPINETEIELRIALSIRNFRRTDTAHPLLKALPSGMMEPFLREQAFRAYKNDVFQDVPIWNHKVYVEQPALALGDGPIARYRKWANQFYSSSSTGGVVENVEGDVTAQPS